MVTNAMEKVINRCTYSILTHMVVPTPSKEENIGS
jgi:hypothetical protein